MKKIKEKNPYLKPDGSIDMIDKYPGIDYISNEMLKDLKKESKIEEKK